jgi:pimeloyl-ACP methyl ester carboxylesterase
LTLVQALFLAVFFTISASAQPAPAEGLPASTEVGAIGKASFRIDLPARPNGDLVVYCHGYGPATKFDKAKPPNDLMKAFLAAGYAVAQSGYSAAGWAVKEALEESEALRQYYVQKHGKPKRTWVMGHSMGGTITIATIETYPQHYDGALQMCGPTGAILNAFHRRIFDMLVVYDYYFPDMIGSPVDPVEADEEFPVRIQKEATAYPDRLEAFQRWSGLKSDTEVGRVVGFFSQIQRELIARAGGNPFDNRNTLYQGSTDDGRLNRGVKRYAATPAAAAYLKKYYTPSGQLKRPMLSLHTVYDPLIPAWSANEYDELARLSGTSELYVQRFASRAGHCAFTPLETMHAMADLVRWRETGARPDAGEQK